MTRCGLKGFPKASHLNTWTSVIDCIKIKFEWIWPPWEVRPDPTFPATARASGDEIWENSTLVELQNREARFFESFDSCSSCSKVLLKTQLKVWKNELNYNCTFESESFSSFYHENWPLFPPQAQFVSQHEAAKSGNSSKIELQFVISKGKTELSKNSGHGNFVVCKPHFYKDSY